MDEPIALTERILVTQDDAAVLLGVHRSTIKRLCAKGELPIRKVGHLTRIHVDELREFADRLPSR